MSLPHCLGVVVCGCFVLLSKVAIHTVDQAMLSKPCVSHAFLATTGGATYGSTAFRLEGVACSDILSCRQGSFECWRFHGCSGCRHKLHCLVLIPHWLYAPGMPPGFILVHLNLLEAWGSQCDQIKVVWHKFAAVAARAWCLPCRCCVAQPVGFGQSFALKAGQSCLVVPSCCTVLPGCTAWLYSHSLVYCLQT